MIIYKVLIIINVLSFFELAHAATHFSSDRHVGMGTENNFTLNQYTGVWYQVAVMYLIPLKSELICEWFNITAEDDCEGCFKEVYRQSLDGKSLTRFYGYGKVVNSQVHITFSGSGSKTRVLTVTSYNNGEELILRDQGNVHTSELISRKPTASAEVRSELERRAMDLGLHVVYVNHDVCRI